MLKIATIIVTYNAEKWIECCLNSINLSDLASDIFLVDNASTDNTLQLIKPENNIEIISLKNNFGFGNANNIAIKKAFNLNHDYYFLINQDVFIEPTTLSSLIDFADKNKDFGIVCPIQFNGNGTEIDFLFKNYINQAKENTTFLTSNFVNAAAWLVSKDCINKVGFFNELFKHYGEDNNYCNRVLFHNFKIAILKNTKVLHDRNQVQNYNKAIALAKIKLLTFFVNPNFSTFKSIIIGLKSVLGISKFMVKKYKSISALNSFVVLFKAYLQLLFDLKKLNSNKNEAKKVAH